MSHDPPTAQQLVLKPLAPLAFVNRVLLLRPPSIQLLLCNPLCFLVYVAAASSFFRRRIPYEEALLESFYPEQYPEYARRTFIGIPFVPNRGRHRSSSRRSCSSASASAWRGGGGGGSGEGTALNIDARGGGGNGRSPPPSDLGSPDDRDSRNSGGFSDGR